MSQPLNPLLRVFVVDDDDDDRYFLKNAFKEHPTPCELIEFENGQELLDFLERDAEAALPDLIILDLNMPRLNGFATLEQVKKHPQWRSIPVVILTTSSYPGDEATCLKLGADAFFVKPPVYANLIRIVDKSIDLAD